MNEKQRTASNTLATGMAAALHFLVDGLCLCCLYLTALDLVQMMGIFVTYNVLAFLTQPLTGWLADRMGQRHWMLLGANVLLTLAVVGAAVATTTDEAAQTQPLCFVVATLLGMGNSLFHVWGGKQVALRTANDIRALGVFVSTGAFGLAVGAVLCSWGTLYLFLLLCCLLSVAYVSYADSMDNADSRGEVNLMPQSSPHAPAWSTTFAGGVVAAMMVMVAMRSFVGEAYTVGIDKSPALLLTFGLTAMLGKMAGGWLVRGLGMWKAVGLMVGGAFLCWLGKDTHLAVVFAGLFLVNCTMPVTLYWANVMLKGKEGLAFGLLAAALMPGYLLAAM